MDKGTKQLLQQELDDLLILVNKFKHDQLEQLRHAIETKLIQLDALLHYEKRAGEDCYIIKNAKPFEQLCHLFQSANKNHVFDAKELNLILDYINKLHKFELKPEHFTTLNHHHALQNALDSHAIVSKTDNRGTILSVNETFCRISGYSRQELIGENHRLLNSRTHPKGFFEDMWRTILSGQNWKGTVCNRKKSGELYWVESTINPLFDSHKNLLGFISIRTDVTKTILVQKKVEQSEARLRLAQKFTNIGSWDWNIKTNELIWSDNIPWLITGEHDTSMKTTYDNFLSAIHPDDRSGLNHAVEQALQNDIEYNYEHRVIWRDGQTRWLLEKGHVIRDGQGDPLHMIGTVQDITERKILEQQLEQSLEEAQSANQAKSRFLASMTHELRTPLNSVIGYSQLLRKTRLDENQLHHVNNIETSGKYLLTLINELLDLSSIEAGAFSISLEPVRLDQIIDQTVSLMVPAAQAKQIQIELLSPEQPVEVLADITRIKQVLINYLSNAIKYNDKHGRVKVFSRLNPKDKTIRVLVEDNGYGIAQTQQHNVFEPFHRLGFETSSTEGTGIGLSITKNLIELMNGRVGFNSEKGKGSCFWFELPLLDSNKLKTETIDPYRDQSDTESLRVLYIEDNPMNMELMEDIFEYMPAHTLFISPNAEHGIAQAQTTTPDVILLDINLPGIQGDQALNILKSMKNLRVNRTRFYAISAQSGLQYDARLKDVGFNGLLHKPVDLKQIEQLLNHKTS
jgi:PAS domain S-box-containing protein